MAENDEKQGPDAPAVPEGGGGSGAAAPAQPENRRARRAAASAAGKKKGASAARPPRPGAAESAFGLDASERVDDAFARASDRAVRFLKDHFNVVQWLIVALVATWIGMQIYTWRSEKTAAKVGALLSDAIAADLGKVGAPDQEGKRDERGSVDARRIFQTDEARLAAARDAYQKVSAERPGTAAAGLAKLGLAGVYYDQGKYGDARKLYEEVLASDLAKQDPESKGRALENLGLALEASGDKDGALKRFGELENADIAGFGELALYHQGRLLHEKGDDPAAIEKLKKAVERLGKEKTSPTDPPSYLAQTARALLERIDPKSVPPPSQDEAIRKALEQFRGRLPAGVSQIPMQGAP
ncbi:MAG TPA: tetratricopeptide repeat protein [Polyangiaceae bacterium]|nr:tetratricopeptide repeat protein [Polyangiaceae bacterium]